MSSKLSQERRYADIAESREKKQETQDVLTILIKIMDTPSPLKARLVSRMISESPSEVANYSEGDFCMGENFALLLCANVGFSAQILSEAP